MVQSPITVWGRKWRILPYLKELFPKVYEAYGEPFVGSYDVGININARHHYIADKDPNTIGLLNWLRADIDHAAIVDDLIARYEPTTKAGYYRLRDDYNETPRRAMLFVLMLHSFQNMLRFNNNGTYNVPFGGGRTFNDTRRMNLNQFVAAFKKQSVTVACVDFTEFSYYKCDFVYLDPPYLVAGAAYNADWTIANDALLFDTIDRLVKTGLRFGMSNVYTNNGKTNTELMRWATQYTVYRIPTKYQPSPHRRKYHTEEVYITNV